MAAVCRIVAQPISRRLLSVAMTMPENAIKFDGPISLLVPSKEIAEAIFAACWSQPGTPLRAKD
jgi:hypothetical protein